MTRTPDDIPAKNDDWARFRDQMPVARRWAYFDHAAVAPLSGPARAAMQGWLEDATQNGDFNYLDWLARVDRLRSDAAAMLRTVPEQIALIRNTTEGVNLVAEGFPWQPGDNVVIRSDEFPANQYPWLHLADRGVETRRVAADEDGRLDLDRLAAACDRRTRILSVSWVAFADGWRHDVDRLAQMAHDRGALLMLDAIQGLGVFPLDVSRTPVDFLAADGHKWLLGPEGAGVFYLRSEHLDLLRPTGIGWNSVAAPFEFTQIDLHLKQSAARYEGGSPNMGGLIGLGASIDLLRRFGPEAIGRRIVELTDLACERLGQIGAIVHSDRCPERKSGIVTFELPDRDPDQIRLRCLEREVVLSCRGGRLRISPHAYNDASDVDRLIEALS